MPIGGTTQSDAEDPVGNWTFQLMTAAIESDPVWQATKGDYYNLPKEKHPLPGVAFGWSVLGLTGYDLSYRTTQAFTAVQPEVFYWDPPNEKAGSSVTKRAASTTPLISSGAIGSAKPTTSIRISAASSRGHW